jgi:hypothetical protein
MGTGITQQDLKLDLPENTDESPGSFPLTKNTWCLSLNPGALHDPKKTHFKGEIYNSVQDKITSDFLNNIESLVIVAYLFEPSSTGDMTSWVQYTLDYCSQSNIFPKLKNVHVLYDSVIFHHAKIVSQYSVIPTYIPYYLLRSTLTKSKGSNFEIKPWSPKPKKALFLIGDGLRINRFPLLYEFYKNDNLKLLDYSLNYNYIDRFNSINDYFASTNFDNFSKYMYAAYGIDKSIFQRVYKNLQHKFPEDEFVTKVDSKVFNHFDISAYCFPKKWANSALILTAETMFFQTPAEIRNNETITFSEKTWKPILSKKPFISCSESDFSYSILENLGFKTFLEYTSHPNKIATKFTDINQQNYYPKIAYERTCSFLENMTKFEDRIFKDIEHNYALWVKLGNQLWEDLYKGCPPLKQMTKDDVTTVFSLGGHAGYLLSLEKNNFWD